MIPTLGLMAAALVFVIGMPISSVATPRPGHAIRRPISTAGSSLFSLDFTTRHLSDDGAGADLFPACSCIVPQITASMASMDRQFTLSRVGRRNGP